MKRLVPPLALALLTALAPLPASAQVPPASAIAAVPPGDVPVTPPQVPIVEVDDLAPLPRTPRMGRRVMENFAGLEQLVADRKPMERLRSEISLYHEARGIPDPRKRQAMLDELDGRPSHRDARASLVRMLRKADGKPNPMYQLRLVQAGLSWIVEVDGSSSAAVPEMAALRALPNRERANSLEMQRVLQRLAQLVEQSARTSRPASAAAKPAGKPADSGGGSRAILAVLALLATLGVGVKVGRGKAGAATPAPKQPAASAPGGDGFLPLLREAMSTYVGRIHRVKNQLGIAARFEGDPDGLIANLFEPDTHRELTSNLERTRAELALLGTRVAATPDLPPAFAPLLARGERLFAGALETLKGLEAEHRSGTAPDLPARVEREVGRLARDVRGFSTDLCAVSDRHAITPRDLVEEVVGRTAYRDAVTINTSDGFPASYLVPDAERARSGLTTALSNLLDNAHQAGARRIAVHLAFAPAGVGGQLTVAVADDGPGVPAAARDKLFAPRFTTRAEGTGMGLFGARKAVQELGGDAGHTAPAAGGAEFWLKVPALAA